MQIHTRVDANGFRKYRRRREQFFAVAVNAALHRRSRRKADASGESAGRVFCYLGLLSVGTASIGDSKAMNSTHGSPFAQEALCGNFAGPYAYMPGFKVTGS